jgi:protein transport protein SEC20
MAQTEVVKSSINIEELEYSTKSLKELQGKYSAFDLMLNGSQRLVRHLEEADKWDRIYMIASLSFLAAVLFWIVWRRILKAPTMLFLWTLTKGFKLARYVGGVRSKKLITEPVIESSITSDELVSIVSTIGTIVETIVGTDPDPTGIVHSDL